MLIPACSSEFSLLSLETAALARNESDAATCHSPFLDRGAGGVQGVVDPVLLLLDLDLGRAADADHRDAAGELRPETLLQLLLVL